MLNFDYLQPPAIVQPAEVAPSDAEPAENLAGMSWRQAKRKRRQDIPLQERSPAARKFFRKRQEAKAAGTSCKAIVKEKKRLRQELFAADPHCAFCRKPVQIESGNSANFGSVLLAEKVLCCQRCMAARLPR